MAVDGQIILSVLAGILDPLPVLFMILFQGRYPHMHPTSQRKHASLDKTFAIQGKAPHISKIQACVLLVFLAIALVEGNSQDDTKR
jgi:hypothetical protein